MPQPNTVAEQWRSNRFHVLRRKPRQYAETVWSGDHVIAWFTQEVWQESSSRDGTLNQEEHVDAMVGSKSSEQLPKWSAFIIDLATGIHVPQKESRHCSCLNEND